MKYDILNRNEPSKVYVAKVDKIPLYCINNGIDEESFTVTKNLNNTSQLSFTLYKEVDGISVNGYDYVNELMLLYVTDCGWFKINSTPEVSNDGYKETKSVSAESIEIELQGYDIIGIDINTAQPNSLEMLIEKNVDEDTKIPKRNISLYNKDDKKFSLLDILINEYIPWWHIQHVDNTLIDGNDTPKDLKHVMYFSIDNQDLYSFFTQTLAQAFQCVFVFDNETFGISVYDPKSLGQDTNIFIGYRNIQNSLNITTDTDNLYTTYNVAGGEGLDNIYLVNYGTSTIENIDHYLNTKYLSQTTINHYKSWRDFYNSNRAKYGDYSISYNKFLKQSTEIQNRVPSDGCETNWGDYNQDELLSCRNDYEAQLKGYEKLYVNGNNEFDISILKQYPAEYADYISIKETVLPNINTAINNLGLTEDDKVDYLTAFETDWKLYGVDELNTKLKVYKNTLDVYADFEKDYDSSNHTYSKEYYISKHNYYVEQKGYYDECFKAYDERKTELEKVNLQLNEVDTKRKELITSANKSNFMSNDEILSVRKLYRNTDYQNENIVVTPIDTQADIVKKQEQLYQIAIDELSASSQPQYNYSTTVENILALADYEYEIKSLKLGNFIHIELDTGKYVKLRINTITFNPLLYTNSVTLGFTNMITYRSKRNDFVSLLARNSGTSKNSISVGKSNNQNNENNQLSVALLQKIVNSPYLKSNISSYATEGISNFKTDVDNIISKYVKTDELETKVANIHELNVDSAFMKYLNSIFLTTDSLLADTAYINNLKSKFAQIDFANVTKAVISGAIIKENAIDTAHIHNGAITDAKILNLDAGKIKTGSLDTTLITIGNKDKNLLINDSTIQINDATRTRVQIGKDSQGDYNIYIYDKVGNLMFDASGIHASGIKSPIIVDNMISSNAAISGDKIDIHSLVSNIENSTETLTANSITYNGESLNTQFANITKQVGTLDSEYSTLSLDVTGIKTSMGSYVTKTGLSTTLGDYSTIDSVTSAITQSKKDITTEVTKTLSSYSTTDQINEKLKAYSNTETTKALIKTANDSVLATVSGSYVTKATYDTDVSKWNSTLENDLKNYYTSTEIDSKLKATSTGIESSVSKTYTSTTVFTDKIDTLNGRIDNVKKDLDAKNVYALKSIVMFYNSSTQNQTAPTGYKSSPLTNGWAADRPDVAKDHYLWTVMCITYTNGVVNYSDPVCVTGHDGVDGKIGKDGRGIKTSVSEYALGDTMDTQPTTGWTTDLSKIYSNWQSGKYIWARQHNTYTDNTSDYSNYQCDTSSLFSNKLQVGGRNIYIQSDRDLLTSWQYSYPLDDTFKITSAKTDPNFKTESVFTISYKYNKDKAAHIYKSHSLDSGKRYTFSFNLVVNKCPSACVLDVYSTIVQPNSTVIKPASDYGVIHINIDKAGFTKRCSITFTAKTTTFLDFALSTLGSNATTDSEYEIVLSEFQLEVGDFATDFSINENDIFSIVNTRADQNIADRLENYSTKQECEADLSNYGSSLLSQVKDKYASKADATILGRGLNKYEFFQYDIQHSVSSGRVFNIDELNNILPFAIDEIDSSKKGYSISNYKINGICKALTNVHVTKSGTWSSKIMTIENGALYVNGVLILKTNASFTSFICNLHEGWNTIAIYFNTINNNGSFKFEFETDLKTSLPYCDIIDCYAIFSYEYSSFIRQTSDSIMSQVSKKVGKNEIISTINQYADKIEIDASKVDLSGYVSFTSLKDKSSQTFINGANVITGTIDATALKVDDLSAFHATIAGWDINQKSIEKFIENYNKDGTFTHTYLNCTNAYELIGVESGHYEDNENHTHFWVDDYNIVSITRHGKIQVGDINRHEHTSGLIIAQDGIDFESVSYKFNQEDHEVNGHISLHPWKLEWEYADRYTDETLGIYAGRYGCSISDGKAVNAYMALSTWGMNENCISFPHHTIWAPQGICFDHRNDYNDFQVSSSDPADATRPTPKIFDKNNCQSAIYLEYDRLTISSSAWILIKSPKNNSLHPLAYDGTTFGVWDGFNNRGNIDFGTDGQRFQRAYFYDKVYASGGFDSTSDRKKKMNFSDLESDWVNDFIMSLKPQFFNYKTDSEQQLKFKHMGFIAQDVHDFAKITNKKLALYSAFVYENPPLIDKVGLEEVDPNITYSETADSDIIYNDEDDIDDAHLSWSLNYIEFIAPLTKFIQNQENTIRSQQKAISDRQTVIDNLISRISKLENKITKDEK